MPIFEEPKKKSGEALALALANMGGLGGVGLPQQTTGYTPLMAEVLGIPQPTGYLAPRGGDYVPPAGGDSSGMRSGGEPRGYGDAPSISGAISAALGGGLLGASAGRLGSSAIGYGAGALSGPLGAALTGYGLMSMIGNAVRSWSGAPEFEANPIAAAPTLGEIQGAYDYGGFFAGEAARQAREDANRSFYGINNPLGMDSNMGGFSPSGNFGTGESGSAQGGTGGGGGFAGGDPGMGGGNPGGTGDKARGGVLYATHPQTVTFGEPSTGGEWAAFIPKWMEQHGYQPGERAIRRSLRQKLLQLGG